jgi:serine/threonine protein kinase
LLSSRVGAYKLTGPEWDSISPEAKDLVRKMLDISPESRITTYGVLAHPWIQKAGDFDSYVPEKTANVHAESAAAGNDALVSGLHGKSSIVHGHLLRGSLVDGVAVTAAMPSTPGGKESEKNLSRALDHLADHIKVSFATCGHFHPILCCFVPADSVCTICVFALTLSARALLPSS